MDKENRFLSAIAKNMQRIILIGCCSVLLIACDKGQQSADEEPVLRFVKVLNIKEPAQFQYKEFPGVVAAAQKAELTFRVSGRLEELLAKEGDVVSKDQLLARLDDTDHRIQLDSQQAEYKQKHADFIRGKKLVGSGVISRSDFNKLEAQNSTAEAALAAAKQTLGYTVMRAPFAGQIAKRHIDNFEEVAAMQPIYLLQDISTLLIKVNIPASLMIQTDEKKPPELTAFFDAIPGQSFPVQVKEVSTQADEATNTYQVTLSMSAVEGYNVLPGMSVTVRGQRPIDNVTNKNAFYVPVSAVLGDEKGQYVYIAIPSSEGQAKVEQRRVETGRISQAGLEILSGLKKGDALIVAGMSKMYPGLEVRLHGDSSL